MISQIIQTACYICSLIPTINKYFEKWSKKYAVEPVANTLVSIAQSITKTTDISKLQQQIKSDPKLANELQEAFLKNRKEIELAIIKDKQNARARDIAINKIRKNIRADIMVISAAVGLVSCLIFIACFRNLPGEIIGIISTIAGIFGSCLKDAYSFEFGSSRGSKEKDQTVASMIDKFNN